MIENEELRTDIDRYLMKRFKYRKSLIRMTMDNIIIIRRNSRVDLYLRIRRIESRFPPDCLIIARLSFSKVLVGHGTHFLKFLTKVARRYGFNHIGIECINSKSSMLAKKVGFYSIDGENFAIAVNNLMHYFSME